jgi:hypothetical protein
VLFNEDPRHPLIGHRSGAALIVDPYPGCAELKYSS